MVRLWISRCPSPAATPDVAYTTAPVGSVVNPAYPGPTWSIVALPSNPSRLLWYVRTWRSVAFRDVAGRNIAVEPLSLNSQSSWPGCQANFTKPGLVTAPAHAAGVWCDTRPGPGPKSVTPAARSNSSSEERGRTVRP